MCRCVHDFKQATGYILDLDLVIGVHMLHMGPSELQLCHSKFYQVCRWIRNKPVCLSIDKKEFNVASSWMKKTLMNNTCHANLPSRPIGIILKSPKLGQLFSHLFKVKCRTKAFSQINQVVIKQKISALYARTPWSI